MENKSNYAEERFDSFLNKTIILSSKAYFKKQMKHIDKEKTIFNNENYREVLGNFDVVNEFTDNIETKLELNNALNSLSAIEQSVLFCF